MISRLNITIIGWYGTETIGDRAILAGIIRIFSEISSDIYIRLGSLYPILSERTIRDDGNFLESCARKSRLNIDIFDSQSKCQLEHAIKHSDALVIGGGPLMDLVQMYMLEYALTYAKTKNKRTIVFGCGYGPLMHADTIQCSNHILELADLSIMRDSNAPYASIINQIDPASFACMNFLEMHKRERSNDYYAVNLREITATDIHYKICSEIEERLIDILHNLFYCTEKPVRLVPMHTFSVGGDDRIILNRISNRINSSKIDVITRPPSLEETMDLYYNAIFCVGMRFHAVVIQTLLNGNNTILDYTNPTNGKIIEFLRQMNLVEVYADRYISLSQPLGNMQLNVTDKKSLPVNYNIVRQSFSTYVNALTNILNK